MIKLIPKHIQKWIARKGMTDENQDAFRRPCAVFVPNFHLYATFLLTCFLLIPSPSPVPTAEWCWDIFNFYTCTRLIDYDSFRRGHSIYPYSSSFFSFFLYLDLRKAKMKRISDLKVPELHDELTKRGLSKKGKKQELINVSIDWVIESQFFVWAWTRQDMCRRNMSRNQVK